MNYRLLLATYISGVFVRQIDAFEEHGIRRALAAFDRADEEARQFWEGIDDAEDYETALGRATDYYDTLHDVRQGMANLLAAGLYHLFEQQRSSLEVRAHRTGVTLPRLQTSAHWPTIDEARLVANVVKHAEGGSAEQLKARRPDLFQSLVEKEMGTPRSAVTINRPLAGEDMYVSDDDLYRSAAAIRALWIDATEAMRSGASTLI
jgi:hypothetical protein